MSPTSKNRNSGCLTAIFNLFNPRKEPETLPYTLRENLFSPTEFSFYKVLLQVTNNKVIILCKVRLGDIFNTVDYRKNIGYANRINQKHIDFLLCDPTTTKPILGIELDDSTHHKSSRQERDNFVDNVFKVAKLPILHTPAKIAYSQQELFTQIKQVLSTNKELI